MYRAVKKQEASYAQSLVVPTGGEYRDDKEETKHVRDVDVNELTYINNEITKEEAR